MLVIYTGQEFIIKTNKFLIIKVCRAFSKETFFRNNFTTIDKSKVPLDATYEYSCMDMPIKIFDYLFIEF